MSPKKYMLHGSSVYSVIVPPHLKTSQHPCIWGVAVALLLLSCSLSFVVPAFIDECTGDTQFSATNLYVPDLAPDSDSAMLAYLSSSTAAWRWRHCLSRGRVGPTAAFVVAVAVAACL